MTKERAGNAAFERGPLLGVMLFISPEFSGLVGEGLARSSLRRESLDLRVFLRPLSAT